MKKIITIGLLLWSIVVFPQMNQAPTNLKSRSGKCIGRITYRNPNVQEIRNCSGYYLGKYDAKTNTTYNRTGKKIGNGNLLTMLITDK